MSDERYHVKIGEVHVLKTEGVLFAIGLGSCVAVTLYDSAKKVAGLAHVMLPDAGHADNGLPGRCAPRAIPHLVEQMLRQGARKRGMYARIAGGAAMFKDLLPVEGMQLGDRNVSAVKAALAKASIPLRGEDCGGTFGRSVFFNVEDGSVLIRAVRRDDVNL